MGPLHGQRYSNGRRSASRGVAPGPQDTGLAASVGIASLPVRRRVRLGLFFTGDELVMPEIPCRRGGSTTRTVFTLNGLAGTFGCETRELRDRSGFARRDAEVLCRAAAECDVIVTTAASRWARRTRQAAVEAKASFSCGGSP